MSFVQNNLTFFITTLTLASNIFFVLAFLLILIEERFRRWVYGFVNQNIISLLFIVSLGSLVGSLFYSEIIGFTPCELCWIQRIFMYPQTVLTFIALIKKDKNIVGYLLSLSILGAIVAFYHSMAQWGFGGSLLGCTSIGGACVKVFVFEYGYITIPFMALTSFVYIIGLSIIYYKARNVSL